MANAAKSLLQFDGMAKHACRDWKARARAHLNMSVPDLYDLPVRTGGNLVKWQHNKPNLYPVLFLAANRGATTYSCAASRGKKPND